MKAHMIIATVKNVIYLTKLVAESAIAAEHYVLDLGVCGKHEFSVSGCQAFDENEMRGDTFIGCAINATVVSFNELKTIIEKRNDMILKKDAAEKRIERIEKEMKALTEELAVARATLADGEES